MDSPRNVTRCILLVSLLGLAGCSRLSRTPLIGSLFIKKPTYYHYLDDPLFTCEYPRKWGAGVKIPGGIEFREPEGSAKFSVAFMPQSDPKYQPLDRYRRDMAAWGSVEDSHRISEVSISSRTAYSVQFTTYEYDPEYMLGQKVSVRYSELNIVPIPEGMYLIRYQNDKDKFWNKRSRGYYEYFLKSLVLIGPKKED